MKNNGLNYFTFQGRCLAYDVDRLCEVLVSDCIKEDTQRTIQSSYGIDDDNSMPLVNKDVVETTSTINKDLMSIKYNFINECIASFFTTDYDQNGMAMTFDVEKLGLRQLMAYNTLLNLGIIYEIDTDENE